MHVVPDGNTFSKYGAGRNLAQQNGRKNWTLFSTGPSQMVNSVDGSGWSIASDGDPAYSGAITQVLNGLTIGTTYDVIVSQAAGQFDCSLDANGSCTSGNYNQNTTNWWEVDFGSIRKYSQTIHKQAKSAVSPWQQQVISFVADNTTALLQFMANGTPDNQPPMALHSGVSLVSQSPDVPPETPQNPSDPTPDPTPDPPNDPVPPDAPDPVPGPLGVLGCGIRARL